MSTMTAEELKKLLTLLGEEKTLADSFLALTDEQGGFLHAEDMDSFEKSIEKRQEIITKIDELRDEIAELIRPYQENDGVLADSSVRELRLSIRESFKKAREKNAKNEKLLRKQMDKISDDIKKLASSKKGIGAYGQGGQLGGSEYFDREF